jgi:release factor glutamine methyltransferase
MGLERAALAARINESPAGDLQARYEALLSRREERVPVAYLIGTREFWSLDFHVDDRVLIPRPETEHVVEHSVRLLRDVDKPRIADIGTGAGPIAVALAHEIAGAEIDAVDLSTGALEVARGNAERHGVADRIHFHQGDALGPLLEQGLSGRFDLVASNPPYVSRNEADSVQEEVRRWEPEMAVFAGERGDEVIARLIPQAAAALRRGGHLVMEISLPRLAPVRALIEADGRFDDVADYPDLAGMPRVVIARGLGGAE